MWLPHKRACLPYLCRQKTVSARDYFRDPEQSSWRLEGRIKYAGGFRAGASFAACARERGTRETETLTTVEKRVAKRGKRGR